MFEESALTQQPNPQRRLNCWLWILLPAALIGMAAVTGTSKWFFQEQRSLAAEPALDLPIAENANADAAPVPRDGPDAKGRERMRAPELDGGVAWLNTAAPIHLRDLRGKIVLLDFWTLCCINCIHIMPDLAKLEKKYPNELVVVGVHSSARRFRHPNTVAALGVDGRPRC